jgi:gp16 family phage-associated protein
VTLATNPITLRFHKKKTTISEWARENGFKENTVFQLIRSGGKYKGVRGTLAESIFNKMVEDGFIKQVKFKKKKRLLDGREQD